MKDITVDIGVLMSASRMGDPPHHDSTLRLTEKMKEVSDAGLALDARGKIEQQYGEKLGGQSYGAIWVKEMATKGKVVRVEWGRFNRGVKTALEEAHFDWEDFKYVQTAASTSCKWLVSHDPDYSPTVRQILRKRLEVSVVDAASAGCSLHPV